MKRGNVVLVQLDPTIGSEANKTRPAIVVSNDRVNAVSGRTGRGMITVVPLTSKTERIYPFQVFIVNATETGLSAESKAQAEQIRSIDIRRVREVLGRVTPQVLAQIDSALKLHLNL